MNAFADQTNIKYADHLINSNSQFPTSDMVHVIKDKKLYEYKCEYATTKIIELLNTYTVVSFKTNHLDQIEIDLKNDADQTEKKITSDSIRSGSEYKEGEVYFRKMYSDKLHTAGGRRKKRATKKSAKKSRKTRRRRSTKK